MLLHFFQFQLNILSLVTLSNTNFSQYNVKQATLARLKTWRLTTSHIYLYKKLDEFGKDHKKSICDAVVHQGQYIPNKRCLDGAEQPQCPQADSADSGRKLVFDKLDYTQEVHWMTWGHQNIDCHYVTAMSTENRVSGNELNHVPPAHGVMGMENGKCVPSNLDNARQWDNYIKLVERILVSNIPCLGYQSDVCTRHIQYKYSHEMTKKTNTVRQVYIF